MTKYIFVTGGVVSSLGKGINGSSIGRLLKARGLKVFMQKFDPYINVDPGNMSPLQHGEVFVTEDGAETDLDLGHYERFIDENLSKHSSVTTGKIYLEVINKERNGEYDGKTVQVIPHITNAIKESIYDAASYSNADVVITEVGGTVGDIESLPFLEAIRHVRREKGVQNTFYIHNTLVPYLQTSKELKTKPTQHSVKELRSIGINPDMIILRCDKVIKKEEKEKIALFCDVGYDSVIEARSISNIYELPLVLANQNVDKLIMKHFNLEINELNLQEWYDMLSLVKKQEGLVKIAIVGKYVQLRDAYLSIIESLNHAGIHLGSKVDIDYIDAEKLDGENVDNELQVYNGLLVPGGFGERAIDGKLIAIKYARENNVPFFGICLGMQLAVIEYARNVLGYKDANSSEFDTDKKMPIFDFNYNEEGVEKPMRIGSYKCKLTKDSKAFKVYGKEIINERHRHRYEFNNKYRDIFKDNNFKITGINPEADIVEVIELKEHKWFLGCQFHPEFTSRPTKPHPLFMGFLKAAIDNK